MQKILRGAHTHTHTILDLKSEFKHIIGYKINVKKLNFHILTITDTKIKYAIFFISAQKYFGVNLAKYHRACRPKTINH